MKEMEYNPILVFKNQEDEQGDECNDLGKDDFLLAIQTECQRDVMIKYGEKVWEAISVKIRIVNLSML